MPTVGEHLTTGVVAEQVAVGRKTLDQRFVKALGHPAGEKIRLTRLRRAKTSAGKYRDFTIGPNKTFTMLSRDFVAMLSDGVLKKWHPGTAFRRRRPDLPVG